jgi:hypothetical protein
MTITIEAVKNYNPELALYNKILDNLKLVYKSHKLFYRSDKTPLQLLVMVHNERKDSYRYELEVYDQALQALIDLVNQEAI